MDKDIRLIVYAKWRAEEIAERDGIYPECGWVNPNLYECYCGSCLVIAPPTDKSRGE